MKQDTGMFGSKRNAQRWPLGGSAEDAEAYPEPGGYAGYVVRDPLGRKIGTADELFTNDRGGVEYLSVNTGLLGRSPLLLPVELVSVDEESQTLKLH